MLKMGFTSAEILSAGTPIGVTYEINGATDWVIIIENTGSNDLTALSIARSPLGSLYETATVISTGIPLAAGGKLVIEGVSKPVKFLQITYESTVGTTLSVEGSGN